MARMTRSYEVLATGLSLFALTTTPSHNNGPLINGDCLRDVKDLTDNEYGSSVSLKDGRLYIIPPLGLLPGTNALRRKHSWQQRTSEIDEK